ncbi:hypothetical protein [Nocardia pseudobrasiliensis]|uniref:hypothetical protein n=1 Tax=Nocardia pseudobrasiliensis TaxID=45979 RepID=UPI0008331E82|nr:hypothetical protein [Nocardia pseudobrasiliensis]
MGVVGVVERYGVAVGGCAIVGRDGGGIGFRSGGLVIGVVVGVRRGGVVVVLTEGVAVKALVDVDVPSMDVVLVGAVGVPLGVVSVGGGLVEAVASVPEEVTITGALVVARGSGRGLTPSCAG